MDSPRLTDNKNLAPQLQRYLADAAKIVTAMQAKFQFLSTKTELAGKLDVHAKADSAGAADTAVTLAIGADRTKLDGIAAGAEVNVNADWTAVSGDAQILNKPALGTAAAQNIGAFDAAGAAAAAQAASLPLHAKADTAGAADTAVALATGTDRTKLDGIAAGATVGADWNTNVSNKPTLGTIASHATTEYVAVGTATWPSTGTVLTDASTLAAAKVSGNIVGNAASITGSITKSQVSDFAHNQAETTITFTDVTTGNASTSAHGFTPKAVAPAAGSLNALAIANGETVFDNHAILATTVPTTQAFGDAAAAGSALEAAHVDHKHAMMAAPTSVSGNAGTATKLAATKTINGVAFDGSANIIVPYANYIKTTTVVTGTAAATLSGANMVGGAIFELTGTTARTFTLDTGTNISTAFTSAFGAPVAGNSFEFKVRCSGTSTGTITMAGGTGSTLTNPAVIAIGTTVIFWAVNTGTNTWTIY